MHFHVLGLGAVGRLVSHHLRRTLPPSHNVSIIHKTSRRAHEFLVQGGIINVERDGIVTASTGFHSEPFKHNMSYSEGRGWSTDLPQIDSLIVAVKAYRVFSTMQALLPRLSPNATIVLLQNGMGIYEKLVHQFFLNENRRPHFILGSNTHGVFIKDKETAVHSGVGELQFGIVPDPAGRDFEASYRDECVPKYERTLRLADITELPNDPDEIRYRSLHATVAVLMSMEQLNVSWKPISEMQLVMRRKLVVNAAINSLTALMCCRNGDLSQSAAAKGMIMQICKEAARIFEAEHAARTQRWLSKLSKEGVDTDEVTVNRVPVSLTQESLYEEVLRVAEVTKENVSSMLLDVRVGRKTEIEYITGYLMKLGRSYRIGVPRISTLHHLVKARCEIPQDHML